MFVWNTQSSNAEPRKKQQVFELECLSCLLSTACFKFILFAHLISWMLRVLFIYLYVVFSLSVYSLNRFFSLLQIMLPLLRRIVVVIFELFLSHCLFFFHLMSFSIESRNVNNKKIKSNEQTFDAIANILNRHKTEQTADFVKL